MISTKQLKGLDYPRAELLGKPSIGAHYTREDYRAYHLDENARCVVCGRRAEHAHHVVHRKTARGWTVDTELGRFTVLSPLFALCHECHENFHGGSRYTARWEWADKQYMTEWWNGHTLAHICAPGNDFLKQEGHFVLVDKKTGIERVLPWT